MKVDAKKEIKNEKDYPETFYCRHMKEGVAYYNSEDGSDKGEMAFISTETIKEMSQSFIGKPVFLLHQKVNMETLKDDAMGYIIESFYNELDGWLWAKMLIIGDEAKDKINDGWSVSNAYLPTELGGSGSCNNVKFDNEIKRGKFTHMAIVLRPRYERAKIYNVKEFKEYQKSLRDELDEMKNSKEEKKNMKTGLLDFFKMKRETVNSLSDIDKNTYMEYEGRNVKILEIINAVDEDMKKESKEKDDKEKENEHDKKGKAYMDDMYSMNGKDMSIREIVNRYKEMTATKKNEQDEDDQKEKDKDNKETKNELSELKTTMSELTNQLNSFKEIKQNDNEKYNSMFFDRLNKDIPENGDKGKEKEIYLQSDGLKKGKELY